MHVASLTCSVGNAQRVPDVKKCNTTPFLRFFVLWRVALCPGGADCPRSPSTIYLGTRSPSTRPPCFYEPSRNGSENGFHRKSDCGCTTRGGWARFKLVNQEATRTGLEPATSGSTVRGSNQLSYRANGWTEKYIDTPDTRKAFPRRVFAADFGPS